MPLRLLTILLGLAVVFVVLWAMWPSPISPTYWDEPEPPVMTGPLQPDTALRNADVFSVGGPGTAEGLAVSPEGFVYFGTRDGRIQQLTPQPDGTARIDTVAQIGDTMILGLEWLRPQVLGVAAISGLYAVNLERDQYTLISSGVPAHPFGYVNDLAPAPDGRIYFTDSSTRWGHTADNSGYIYEMLENRPNGALYVWDPALHQTRLVRDRLYYPNGVEIAADGESVLIAESFRYRIIRVWVDGPMRGQIDIFADNLPGIPEGLQSDGRGRLFVAMPSRRSSLLGLLHRTPVLARLLVKLPQWALQGLGGPPRPFIMVLDERTGDVLETLHDPDGEFCFISNLDIDAFGTAWFGSSDCGYVARLPLPDLPAPAPSPGGSSDLPSAPLRSDHH